jgi:hypothetical protein
VGVRLQRRINGGEYRHNVHNSAVRNHPYQIPDRTVYGQTDYNYVKSEAEEQGIVNIGMCKYADERK